MEIQYYILRISVDRVGESYRVELSHTDPTSQAQVASRRGDAAINMEALLALELMPVEYGQELARQLFSDTDVKERFGRVETAAQVAGSFLRIVLCIDPSAKELQSLRWECLRHPDTDAALSTSEKVLFSRFMVSSDFRPVKLRARGELTAMIAVSAPTNLEKWELAAVDFKAEVARAKTALGGVKNVSVLGGPDAHFTVDRLIDGLRDGVDILYLVSHGKSGRDGKSPVLILQDNAGKAAKIEVKDLASRIGALQIGPRLVVLASCQSGGDGAQVPPAKHTIEQATLAVCLADAGVPAVLAMQGLISMVTIAEMMPVFFTELLRDGQIDRALAAARGKVRGRVDCWMPVLYTRLTAGRLWYTPSFTGEKSKEVWRLLLDSVREGSVVPILGPRLLEAVHGDSHETARRLAVANLFPFATHEWDDLPRVTEYLSVKGKGRNYAMAAYKKQVRSDLLKQHQGWLPPAASPEPALEELLGRVGDRLRESPNDVHRMLAELPASVYVTTNFDPLLERALEQNQKKPQPVVTRWRYQMAPLSADEKPVVAPSAQAPLVYHAFGAFGVSKGDRGMVLTEDDYFDYLIKTSADKLTPHSVESALVDNALMFLGFRLTDWHFRVLFRLMMSLEGKELLKNYCHVAVQVDPDAQSMADVDGAKAYLAEYFGREPNIQIFWGSAEEFLMALREELAAAGQPAITAKPRNAEPAEDDCEEWSV